MDKKFLWKQFNDALDTIRQGFADPIDTNNEDACKDVIDDLQNFDMEDYT
jgi:hypothetical protein